MKKLILLSLLLVGMISCSKQNTAEPEMPQPTVESSTTANPPVGTYRVTPTNVIVTDNAPATIQLQVWDGGNWINWMMVFPYTITPEGIYQVSALAKPGGHVTISKIPGVPAETAYLTIRNTLELGEPVIDVVTIN